MPLSKLIITVLEFLYPFFRRLLDKKTFFYAACGGGNLVLSWILFFIFYQFVFLKKVFQIEFHEKLKFAFSAYTLSSFCCFIITFLIGFLLMKYVVFTTSELRGRVQFFRYGISSLISAILGWTLLKIFVEVFQIYPSISNVIASCIVVVFSYLAQRNFTFK